MWNRGSAGGVDPAREEGCVSGYSPAASIQNMPDRCFEEVPPEEEGRRRFTAEGVFSAENAHLLITYGNLFSFDKPNTAVALLSFFASLLCYGGKPVLKSASPRRS